MTRIKDIAQFLDAYAPLSYQENYDNAGLICGTPNNEVKEVLLTLDCTEEVIAEAVDKNCNLVIAHHPIVFKGLKKITGKNYVERTIIKAIKNDIAIYATHTNLDHVSNGVNYYFAQQLGLKNTHILAPKKETLSKLTVFVPKADSEKLLESLHKAGAGQIGNYNHCSFQISGQGTFVPNEKAKPSIGQSGKMERVEETRLEVILPSHVEAHVISAMKNAHPYEEVAYYLQKVQNETQEVGAGMIGSLLVPMNEIDFMQYIKKKMHATHIRHTKLLGQKVKQVAICGGAGSFLLNRAKNAGAQFFITSDFKYHEFFDAENQIVIADIGHYESEVATKELLHNIIIKRFSNIAAHLSITKTNPIYYF